jgi:hypothetical protein
MSVMWIVVTRRENYKRNAAGAAPSLLYLIPRVLAGSKNLNAIQRALERKKLPSFCIA